MQIEARKLFLFCLVIILIFRILQSWPLNSRNSLEIDTPSMFFQLRESLARRTELVLPQPQAALLNGIVLGLKSDLPTDFKDALINTSTVHIVVASGQNLTLLSGFLISFASLFGRKKTVLASIGICIFYAFLTGLQIPIIRAAIMMIFASIGKLFNREVDSWFCLLLSGLFMLIFEPNWLLSVSFQLSFLATIGVVILAPEVIRRASFVPEVLREDLFVSLSAQALTAPIIAATFHQFSLSGLIVNCLVLWVVAPIMILGAILMVISILAYPVGTLFSLIPNVLLTYFIYIVGFFNQSWSSIWIGKINEYTYFGYYLLLAAIYYLLKNKDREEDPLQAAKMV